MRMMFKVLVVLIFGALILSACEVQSEPIPQDSRTAAPVAGSAQAVKAPSTIAPKVSSCDQVREQLLTGSAVQVRQAMTRLKNDRAADGTAREYAGYWLRRDKSDQDMREMDESLINMSCGG